MTADPRVWNRRLDNAPPGAIYVGRPSYFGNPFVEGRDGDRAQVIAAYEKWLLAQPDMVRVAKSKLRGRDLVCWCAPLPCHADVLLRIANE